VLDQQGQPLAIGLRATELGDHLALARQGLRAQLLERRPELREQLVDLRALRIGRVGVVEPVVDALAQVRLHLGDRLHLAAFRLAAGRGQQRTDEDEDGRQSRSHAGPL
jgi:hypothetical protein